MGCGSSKYAAAATPANALQARQVPSSTANAPHVAVVLPGHYGHLIKEDSKFHYHILENDKFSMFKVMDFDADPFVESAISYCKSHGIKGVFGFDCFPSLLASIINTSLNLPGASFRSVFHCISKYYMRKALSPDVPITKVDPLLPPPLPEKYPVVLKEIDCQFYVGTWVVHHEQEWNELMAKLQKRSTQEFDRRRQFYFKWFQKLNPESMPEQRWQDLVMYHVEPYFEGAEHQIEIVMDQSNGDHTLIADTGDLIKSKEILTMFVTPGSFEVPKDWTHGIMQKLQELGYKNQALDLEFIFTKDGPQLVEINSRYSYMGYWSWYTKMSDKCTLMHQPDVRNLENRTCSCLGLQVPKFPSDMNVISKLAVAVYTNKTGKVDDIVDTAFLNKFLEEGKAECWTPKPAFKAGYIDEGQLEYGGGKWAKLGFMMLTAKRTDFAATNAKLVEMFQGMFREPGTYLLTQDDEAGYKVDKHAIDF